MHRAILASSYVFFLGKVPETLARYIWEEPRIVVFLSSSSSPRSRSSLTRWAPEVMTVALVLSAAAELPSEYVAPVAMTRTS